MFGLPQISFHLFRFTVFRKEYKNCGRKLLQFRSHSGVTKLVLSPTTKDLQRARHKCSVIYEYKCHCHSRYVGRTFQRLQDRIKQHVSKYLIQYHTSSQRRQADWACKKKQITPECDSAIGQHLLKSIQCAAKYYEHQFSILDMAHSRFHLSLPEATYIIYVKF